MANNQDFFAYLNENITIAPANSEEELQASQTIESVFKQYGFETSIQDFSASAGGGFITGVLCIATVVGAVLAGTQISNFGLIGFVITVVCAGLLLARFVGYDLLSGLDSSVRSQNVVAIHRACGDKVEHGSRPIVVVAHYDTPRNSLLYQGQLAKITSAVLQVLPVLLIAMVVLSFLQLMGFIPATARRVIWALAIVASLPVLFTGVAQISTRFMSCTEGANDNKSGVAAMLAVAKRVGLAAQGYASSDLEAHTHDAQDEADVPADRTAALSQTRPLGEAIELEAVEGVRHGAEVLAELGILPTTCTVTYIEPKLGARAIVTEEADAPAVDGEPAAADEQAGMGESLGEDGLASADGLSVESVDRELPTDDVIPDSAPIGIPLSTGFSGSDEDFLFTQQPEELPSEQVPVEQPAAEQHPGLRERITALFQRSFDKDLADDQLNLNNTDNNGAGDVGSAAGTVDDAAIGTSTASSVSNAADKTVVAAPLNTYADKKPSTSQQPARSATQRAALFDLADPSKDSIDPLDAPGDVPVPQPLDFNVRSFADPQSPSNQEMNNLAYQDQSQGAQQMLDPVDNSQQKRKRRGLFNKRKRQQEESLSNWLGVDEDYNAKSDGRSIGSWDNFNSEDKWKGGAAFNERFRVIEGSAPSVDDGLTVIPVDDVVPTDQTPFSDSAAQNNMFGDAISEAELRDASLSLGDDDLIAHDIYFVALGASECAHAGMKAFLSKYRKDCRGAFLFNLSCVGSGVLTILTEEGLDNRRKADRRLVRLIRDTARDIHVDLSEGTMRWGDTDATPAMRTSMRAATIVGFDEAGMPASSHTQSDTADAINTHQIDEVASLVAETIRRS